MSVFCNRMKLPLTVISSEKKRSGWRLSLSLSLSRPVVPFLPTSLLIPFLPTLGSGGGGEPRSSPNGGGGGGYGWRWWPGRGCNELGPGCFISQGLDRQRGFRLRLGHGWGGTGRSCRVRQGNGWGVPSGVSSGHLVVCIGLY